MTSSDEDFVNIFINGPKEMGEQATTTPDFEKSWTEHSSAKQPIPAVIGTDLLKKMYPKHTLALSLGWGLNILGYPGAQVTPLENTTLITNLFFASLPRKTGVPGLLLDNVKFGGFKVVWQQYEFLVYVLEFPFAFGNETQYFILHDGPEEVIRLYLLTTGSWATDLHEEIWVYDGGYWRKDHGLWVEVQKANWKDVILKDKFKKDLKDDIFGFFDSEAVYKELAIPWKRGIIMYGPPGNGKTISMKAVIKECDQKGFYPLYVKSFRNWAGEEAGMTDVFTKARELSPSVIILEDLDSLINDGNRSFFLNQVDGLEGNDGLLIIGTTNHFDRLDPGLSTRPSRFDRKFLFDDPDEDERKLYAQYWQNKLHLNKDIDFPDSLVDEVAKETNRFSFAYLKEAFVSSLVRLAGIHENKPSFKQVILGEIKELRKQLDKSTIMESSIARDNAQVAAAVTSQNRRFFSAAAPPHSYTGFGGEQGSASGRTGDNSRWQQPQRRDTTTTQDIQALMHRLSMSGNSHPFMSAGGQHQHTGSGASNRIWTTNGEGSSMNPGSLAPGAPGGFNGRFL